MSRESNVLLSFNYDYDPGYDPSYDDPQYLECQLGNQSACNAIQEESAAQQARDSKILLVIVIIVIIILVIYFCRVRPRNNRFTQEKIDAIQPNRSQETTNQRLGVEPL